MAATVMHPAADRAAAAPRGSAVFARLIAILAEIGSVWTEVQTMRREAQRRHPYLEL
jgi:hypothetical protein